MSASPSSEADGRIAREVSAGGVVVRTIGGVPHVLVIRDPYGKWGLPKGHLEEGEQLEETALREVREETGLTDLELGPHLETLHWSFTRGGARVRKRCDFFLMRSFTGTIVPEVEEGITACEWVPVDEAESRIDYDNTRRLVGMAVQMIRNQGDSSGLRGPGSDGGE